MQKTNQTNQLDGKKTHKHPLEEEESLQRKAEEHVSNYFATTRECGWRRQWHPTPVLLPGKSHGWRSLVGCSP